MFLWLQYIQPHVCCTQHIPEFTLSAKYSENTRHKLKETATIPKIVNKKTSPKLQQRPTQEQQDCTCPATTRSSRGTCWAWSLWTDSRISSQRLASTDARFSSASLWMAAAWFLIFSAYSAFFFSSFSCHSRTPTSNDNRTI
jgi:hypothetical protein